MSDRFNYSNLLSVSEQRVLERPEKWRWISSIERPDIRPVHRPDHLEWAKDHCHAPPQRELFIALSGKTIFILHDKVYPVSPGVVMLFNSRERHGRDASIDHRNFRHLWLHISNRHAVTSNLNEIDIDGNHSDTVLKFMSGTTANLLMDVWDQCSTKPVAPVHLAFLKSLITTTFFEAVSDWKNKADTSPHQLIVDSVCKHIEKHLGEDLSLNRLAGIAGYSPYFFHRLFLRYAKMPIHQYVTEVRLEKAKELLAFGQTVSAVSEQIGMRSSCYFSRFFKMHTRLTPSRWCEIHRNQKLDNSQEN